MYLRFSRAENLDLVLTEHGEWRIEEKTNFYKASSIRGMHLEKSNSVC